MGSIAGLRSVSLGGREGGRAFDLGLFDGTNRASGADAYDRPYVVGPSAEIHLPFHLAFEVDALYRRNGFTYYTSGFGFGTPDYFPPSVSRTRLNDWQFPLLGRYEVRSGLIRPLVNAGVVYRHLSVAQTVLLQPNHANTTGFVVGGGISLKLLLLRVSPEIRYTHWFTPPFQKGITNSANFLFSFFPRI